LLGGGNEPEQDFGELSRAVRESGALLLLARSETLHSVQGKLFGDKET